MPPITGRVIGEGFRQEFVRLASTGFGTEIFYSFIIIVCSLMIYFGTKELYKLSSHKGIKYFRRAFLFFAVAYFFRSFIKFILTYFKINTTLNILPSAMHFLIGPLTLFVFMYFSSMAIFYLLYSVMWKEWEKNPRKIYMFHLLAFVIALVSISFNNTFMYFGMNLVLLVCVVFAFYVSRKQTWRRKTKQNLHIIYTLLFSFWILNIIDILIPDFFQTFQLFIYLISAGLFLAMLYKVLKKVGSN